MWSNVLKYQHIKIISVELLLEGRSLLWNLSVFLWCHVFLLVCRYIRFFIINIDNRALNLVSMSSKPEMIFESGFDGYKISWAMGWGMLTMTLTVTIRMRRTNGIYTVQPDNLRNVCHTTHAKLWLIMISREVASMCITPSKSQVGQCVIRLSILGL